ncbi:MAG: flagellar basal-body MS-ring/collar protein FliF [Pseudomonadota bacterium]
MPEVSDKGTDDGVDQFFDRLGALWRGADSGKRVMMIAGGAAIAIILALLVRTAISPTMSLLYSGLESSAANGVIEGLERQGLPYEVRGDAIYVPASERDRARIRLAGEGLPAAGAAGYELLDSLNGFGTTTEMFDAAYWRAKEGELARTILASQQVVRARVHIAQSRRRPFEPPAPVTASVTVTTSTGALSRQQAEAIRHLVGSAISGLSLQDVAIIDQERGVILKAGDQEGDTSLADDAATQAEALRLRVIRLLEARVGPGAAIVEVAVDTARDSETVRERILDPNGRIAVSTETEESEDASSGSADAATVASNLPAGDVEGEGSDSSRQTSRTRQRTNYEISETVRERVSPPGRVQRITVAAMIDGVRDAGDGAWRPRSPEELADLKTLIETAIGYSEERGDSVEIRSLELAPPQAEGEAASSAIGAALSARAGAIAQIAALAIAAAIVALFVIRPLLTSVRETPAALALPSADIASDEPALAGGAGSTSEFSSEPSSADASFGVDDMEISSDGGMGFEPMGGFGGGFASDGDDGPQTLRARVEAAIEAKPERAAQIIGEWLDSAAPAPKRERIGA